jgi:hypothetical protein
VYLDSPATHFIFNWTDTNEELASRHLEQYTRTWSTEHLGEPLARGSNVFTPDDHEYWNNAPDPNVTVPGLFDKGRRAAWMKSATTLLGAFQGVPDDLGGTMQPIVIPPLSIMVLDTRSNRSTAKKPVQFMTEEDLGRLEQWVASLADIGPGLLVIGQPLFLKPGDKFLKPKVLEDYSLADYDQFAKLLRILAAAPRDIAILSGDVHFTRIAEMTLLHTQANPRRIVEVINSPLALVVGLKNGQMKPAPALLKAPGAPPEITGARVDTVQTFQSGDDSAVVLSIARFGLGVRVTTDLWLNRAAGGATRPFSTYQFELH